MSLYFRWAVKTPSFEKQSLSPSRKQPNASSSSSARQTISGPKNCVGEPCRKSGGNICQTRHGLGGNPDLDWCRAAEKHRGRIAPFCFPEDREKRTKRRDIQCKGRVKRSAELSAGEADDTRNVSRISSGDQNRGSAFGNEPLFLLKQKKTSPKRNYGYRLN